MNSSHGMFSQQQQQQQQQHQPTPQQQQQQPLQMVPPAMQQQFSMQQQLQQQQLLRAQQQQTAAPNSIGAAAAQLQPGLVLSQLQGFMAGQPPAQLPPGAASGQPLGQQAAMPQSPGMQPPGVRPLAPPPAAAMLAAISLPPLAPQPAAAVTAAAGAQAAQPPSAAAAAAAAAGGSAGAAAEDPRFEKVGFAKLLGEGLEYYIKKYEIVLGRKSKAAVDVVLGDSAVLSRQHCRIIYNFTTKKWQLVVEGKNGVTVNGTLYTPASGPCNLASQDLLQAGDMSFYFLLPKPPRKPKAKPAAAAAAGAATPAGQASAGATAGGAAGQQQQHNQQNVPGTPVLGAGAAAAAGQLQGSSPMLPGFSPRLPQAGAMLPGLSPAAGAAGGAEGLQHFSSGPLLGGLGPGGFPGVQAYPGGVNMAGSQDLLQPGLGDDDGMMDV